MRIIIALTTLLLVLLVACDSKPSPASTPTATTAPSPEGTVAPGPGSTAPVTTQRRGPGVPSIPLLKAVRVGAHPEDGGWDRIVFEFENGLPAASIEYVASVMQCGSGAAVPIAGTPLYVRLEGVNAHDDNGRPSISSLDIAGPGNSILRARQTCDFEAIVAWALTIDGRQPFKVVTLDSPPRLVIDVKH